ncbi:MAG: 3-phosphoshikimate 1-carboxyvinyltransferase [Verrucomicrobiota bacterium]|jgi:3-phosphoshikimate 1-carboxyvinyltransferase
MPLPAIIEVVPLTAPVHAEITVPGSKSITNRALILAALAKGETTLRGALWSEDTQVMTEALQKLGFEIKIENDPEEFCNRTITVRGLGGVIPNAGTPGQPLELFVGNAGTAARFLSVLVCLGDGVYRLSGVPRMHERPQAPLFAVLRELGCRVDSPNDKLPAVIHGNSSFGTRQLALKPCRVSIVESSQFASALMLCARSGDWEVEVVGENAEESPYVAMTLKLIEAFPKSGGTFQIEPDASSGSYFWAVNATWPARAGTPGVRVARWPESDWQVDARFPRFLPLPAVISRNRDLGDSMMTAIVLSPFALLPARFTDLGRLRVQECERVVALRTELTKCGATVVEEGDTLTVYPSQLHRAEIETYNDHRMAMCFAILGLKVPGVRIKNPACVKKTFPNFFQKLAASPPAGLGAEIRDGRTGRRLGLEELFAE